MFPKNTMPTTVAVPEKPPLQTHKDSTVLYMVGGDQVDGNDSRWQFKRAKICACTVVITTLILVVGILGAITIVLRSQQGTSEAPTVYKEPLLGNDSPLEEPINKIPRIKIDDGGLWPPKNPVTPDLVAVDGMGTVSLSSSPKPVTDGIDIDPEGDAIFEPFVFSSDQGRTYISSSFPYDGFYMRGEEGHPPPSHSEDSSSDPTSEAPGDMDSDLDSSLSYRIAGRTYASSSFPYDGFYMRGEEGEPPPSHSEDSSPDPTSEASGDMDSDLEGSAEPDDSDIPSDSDNSSSSDPSSSSSGLPSNYRIPT
ncbi:uncharacterized protein LOC119725731 isoform X2 [Patiria miniata]|uniref:Uncharacterized protein n=1 Tax=Patiria miniata TaxID=46514 RepID=A0A913ZPA9_PATMI|nr:uncharacterized protein LOC119725731 isoform X2 [Patiria miniata]